MSSSQLLVRIQKPKERDSLGQPSFRFEGIFVWLIAAVAFFLVGYQLVIEYHVVSFNTLDQVSRAMTVWHDDPAKLAAMGFDYPPMTTLYYMLFTLSASLASSLVVIPLAGAVMGGFLAAGVNRFLRFSQMPMLWRYLLVAGLVFSPLTMCYAGAGIAAIMGTTTLMLALAFSLYWAYSLDLRYLVLSSMMSVAAVLSSYDNIIWILAIMVGTAVILAQAKASRDEVEGSIITFLVPVFFAISLWTFFNWVIIGQPFYWLETMRRTVGLERVDIASVNLLELIGQWLVTSNWLVFLVLPLLVVTIAKTKDHVASLAVGFLGISLMMPIVKMLITQDAAWVNQKARFRVNVLSFLGLGVIYLRNESWRVFVGAGAVVLLALSIFFNFSQIKTFPYQNLEGVMVSSIEDGKSKEGTTSVGGQEVGIADEYDMAGYIKKNVSASDSILVDDTQSFGVIALTGKPELFYDRVAHSDWNKQAENPKKPIRYILLAKQNSEDDLAKVYNEESSTTRSALHENERYALYELEKEKS